MSTTQNSLTEKEGQGIYLLAFLTWMGLSLSMGNETPALLSCAGRCWVSPVSVAVAPHVVWVWTWWEEPGPLWVPPRRAWKRGLPQFRLWIVREGCAGRRTPGPLRQPAVLVGEALGMMAGAFQGAPCRSPERQSWAWQSGQAHEVGSTLWIITPEKPIEQL